MADEGAVVVDDRLADRVALVAAECLAISINLGLKRDPSGDLGLAGWWLDWVGRIGG